jgi:hypothetical protein
MNTQIADHSVKGALIGLVVYVLERADLDAALIALVVPIAAAVLGRLSMCVGQKGVANFFAKPVGAA